MREAVFVDAFDYFCVYAHPIKHVVSPMAPVFYCQLFGGTIFLDNLFETSGAYYLLFDSSFSVRILAPSPSKSERIEAFGGAFQLDAVESIQSVLGNDASALNAFITALRADGSVVQVAAVQGLLSLMMKERFSLRVQML